MKKIWVATLLLLQSFLILVPVRVLASVLAIVIGGDVIVGP